VPELPEVETVRRGLVSLVVGHRFDEVGVGRERTVRRTSPREVIDGLTGTTMIEANRRGKYLVCPLDSGDAVMIHLRMSGQLIVAAAATARPAHTHVWARFGDHELRFVDPRTFGEVVVFSPERAEIEAPELAQLGLDPIVDLFDWRALRDALSRTSRGIKVALLDQHLVAGLGNIYTDEVLHRARIRYDRPANTLTPSQAKRLAEAITEVLTEAIALGGSTLGDSQYVDLMGRYGEFQQQHLAYNRAGEPCLTCGKSRIKRVVVGGRSTYFCPRCQR